MKNAKQLTRILIVDDHPVFQMGLASLLENETDLEVCGKTGDFTEGQMLFESLQPDFTIIDIPLLHSCGLLLVKRIRANNDTTGILVA